MGTVTRRAAWRDGADNGWHDDLIWYAAAIHRMKQLTPGLEDFYAVFDEVLQLGGLTQDLADRMAAIAVQWNDPMSLGYQSQVHGTYAFDPQSWPSYKMRRVLWQECAHSQWFFLPWHRAYLVEFEEIVRAHISALSGPADAWALPYWNTSDWEADHQRLGLPLPLRGENLPDDVDVPGVTADADGNRPNPLFNPTRRRSLEPPPDASVSWADATDCLQRAHFANEDDKDTVHISFGGGVLDDPTNQAAFHGDAGETGQLDARPHGTVHTHVGGTMSAFEAAGLDPVFWMHHCNVDRLWETYAHDLQHGYPFQDGSGVGTKAHRSWTTRRFRFIQPSGSVRTWKAPQVLDIGALGYTYDTTAAPPLPPPPQPLPGSEIGPFGIAPGGDLAEPIAAAGPVTLAEAQDVAVSADSNLDVGVDGFPKDAHWLLRFEGIRAALPALTSYDVYLGLTPGADADPHDAEHYAGVLSLFGVAEASRDDGTSSGSGQRRRIDVTAQVRAQATTLRPLDTSIRLVPVDPDPDLARVGLTIERVTLEFG
jgi:tyrosinase